MLENICASPVGNDACSQSHHSTSFALPTTAKIPVIMSLAKSDNGWKPFVKCYECRVGKSPHISAWERLSQQCNADPQGAPQCLQGVLKKDRPFACKSVCKRKLMQGFDFESTLPLLPITTRPYRATQANNFL